MSERADHPSSAANLSNLPTGDPAITEAVRVLNGGGIVAVPTDTVYGLVARFDLPDAVERIYRIKDRPDDRPLPVLMRSVDQLTLLTADVPEAVYRLARKLWPGPLTIVVSARPSVSPRITAGRSTVGLRVPAGPLILDLLSAIDRPLASTSANRTGQPPARSAQEVATAFGSAVDLVLDAGDAPASGRSSTVLDLTTDPYLVRRSGDITLSAVKAILGDDVVA